MRLLQIWTPTVTCAGHLPTYRHWINYLRTFLKGPGRKFAHIHSLHYHTERAKAPDFDQAYADFITELADDHRNIIVLVSDHGNAWGREYPRSEEAWKKLYGSDYHAVSRQFSHQRQPISYIVFPKDWVGWEGPEGQQRRENMSKNTARLANHMDMHYTIRFLLTGRTNSRTRSMARTVERFTLFDDVGDRTCEEASIIPQACACNNARRFINGTIPPIMKKICIEAHSGYQYPILEEYGLCLN